MLGVSHFGGDITHSWLEIDLSLTGEIVGGRTRMAQRVAGARSAHDRIPPSSPSLLLSLVDLQGKEYQSETF